MLQHISECFIHGMVFIVQMLRQILQTRSKSHYSQPFRVGPPAKRVLCNAALQYEDKVTTKEIAKQDVESHLSTNHTLTYLKDTVIGPLKLMSN